MKTAQSVSLSYLDLTRCSGFPPFNTHLTLVTVGPKISSLVGSERTMFVVYRRAVSSVCILLSDTCRTCNICQRWTL